MQSIDSEANYSAIIGGEALEGTITFNADGIATVELPRTSPGSGVFNLEDCQGHMTQAGTYKVTQIDDDIDVTILSDEKARIVGENIQRANGSRVTIKNEDTGEQWMATVQNGRYSLDVVVPPGLQKFSASKPYGSDTYPFTVKVRDPCNISHDLKYKGGLGLLTVSTDCAPKDRQARLNYDGVQYTERLGSDNSVLFEFPVACNSASGEFSVDSNNVSFDTQFSCDGLVRVVVNFTQGANLNLFVDETKPGSNKRTLVYHQNCNFSSTAQSNSCDEAKGQILIDIASRTGVTNTQYYEAKISDLAPAKYIVAMVEYFDRNSGNSGKVVPSEFCGNGSRARVPYTMRWYDGEKWSKRKFTIQPLTCGTVVPENLFFDQREQSIRLVP